LQITRGLREDHDGFNVAITLANTGSHIIAGDLDPQGNLKNLLIHNRSSIDTWHLSVNEVCYAT
jgi:cellulose biosynthesis protein BcsQ